MTDKKIKEMLAQIVSRIDYDIYKAHFVEECSEDPEMSEQLIEELTSVVRAFL